LVLLLFCVALFVVDLNIYIFFFNFYKILFRNSASPLLQRQVSSYDYFVFVVLNRRENVVVKTSCYRPGLAQRNLAQSVDTATERIAAQQKQQQQQQLEQQQQREREQRERERERQQKIAAEVFINLYIHSDYYYCNVMLLFC
jgi:signal transduction histidine kinase